MACDEENEKQGRNRKRPLREKLVIKEGLTNRNKTQRVYRQSGAAGKIRQQNNRLEPRSGISSLTREPDHINYREIAKGKVQTSERRPS